MPPDAEAVQKHRRVSWRLPPILLAAGLALFLAACGGGGGGGGSSAAANQAPTAAFAATPASGSAPLSVSFNASSSTDGDGAITGYAWDFGDGSSGSGQATSHTYTTSGTYTTTLTVTDDDGATAAASRTITVNARVSGTVSVSSGMVFDSDTNDPSAPYTQNDTKDSAQAITSPATVGGYLNIAGAGKAGRSRDIGDTSDYYRATLSTGQTVALRFADANAANLDLYLYDSDGTTQLAASVGTGTTETITIAAAWGTGPFYIRAAAASGASSYTLFIGQSASAAGPEELHLGDDFVPGEVVVTFSTDAIAAASAETLEDKARSVGLQGLAGEPGRPMRLGFRGSFERQEAFDRLGIAPEQAGARVFMAEASERQDKWDTIEVIRALRKRSDVVSADPNYRVYAAATVPNDTNYAARQAWHYGLINLPTAWDAATGNDSVIVAVVDTGVVLSHPDLDSRVVAGYDFVKSTSSSNDGDGIDGDPDDPGDDTGGASSFHGTHVAGTIAAETNNSQGVAGVTWAGKVMPVRVLGIDGGTSYDVMQGVRFAAGLSNDSGTAPAQAAAIINLSLGGASYSASEQSLYTTVRSAGIIVVAAAGNAGSSAKSYPAAYNDVVSVSAIISDKSLAPYSSYGSTIDVAAPGGNSTNAVYSTLASDSSGRIVPTYGGYYGTSMATPHVAGVAALMKGVYSSLTPDAFDTLLRSESITEDLGTADRDDSFGYGLIDAQKAVAQATALAAGGSLPTTLVVDPDSLNFGTSATSQTVTVSKSGTGSVGTVSVSSSAAWLSVATGSVDGAGLGTYTVTVNRSSLSDGIYSGTVTFTSTAAGVDDVEVAVTMTVSTTTASSDGGFHYTVLVDPDTLEAKYQTTGTMTGGKLDFDLTGVAAGTYRLYAGTDMDNDGYIGDTGESVGAYTAYRSPVSITVSTGQSGLDFEVEFNTVSLFSTSAADDTPRAIQRLSPTKAIQ